MNLVAVNLHFLTRSHGMFWVCNHFWNKSLHNKIESQQQNNKQNPGKKMSNPSLENMQKMPENNNQRQPYRFLTFTLVISLDRFMTPRD